MAVAVDPAAPGEVAGGVVLFRPLSFEQRFGLSVTDLLVPVGEHGVSPVMPYHRCRAEAEREAFLLKTPADVDIVAGGANLFIEYADIEQRGFAECHVASGDMFRFLVAQEHVDRTARSVSYAIGNRTIVRRREVRPAYTGMASGEKRMREVLQPVPIGIRVVIEVCDNLASRCFEPEVSRVAESVIFSADDAKARIARYRFRIVGGSIVDDEYFEVRVVDARESIETFRQGARAVVRTHHY